MPYTDGPFTHGYGPGNLHGLPNISDMSTNNNNNNGQRLSQSHESESGELIDGDLLLSQFHADAIKQAGGGKYQLIATIIMGMGLAGHAIQVFGVSYIVPSAEVEFCIMENEKNWLSGITLIGMAVGGLIWGGLAGRTGRRKALISCMGVSSVFSVIAAFMPTYGPFMMARFCAACGVVGAVSAGSCYIAELSPPSVRARFLGIFGVFGIAGGILAGYLATLVLPSTGQEIMIENKEHFSAWHRYLLLGSLPTIFSLFGLFWLSESPRWLLENGREVEALGVYQNIYKTNRARGGYALTELELPGSRFRHISPPSVLADMAISCSLFFGSFTQLFRRSYVKTTILLLAAWTATFFVFTGLTIFTSKHSKETSAGYYYRNTIITSNRTYRNSYFNTSMDNQIYSNCTFLNTTFRDLFMTHITFLNSTFVNTEFSNVKTSGTVFEYSVLDNVSLVDTDLTDRHFTDCIRHNNTITRMSMECDRDFEYNIYFDALWTSQFGLLVPAFIMIGLSGEAIYRCGKTRIASNCLFRIFDRPECNVELFVSRRSRNLDFRRKRRINVVRHDSSYNLCDRFLQNVAPLLGNWTFCVCRALFCAHGETSLRITSSSFDGSCLHYFLTNDFSAIRCVDHFARTDNDSPVNQGNSKNNNFNPKNTFIWHLAAF
ncbi:synaptic vesicle glycoprotein 2C-like isoform X3 [Culicoides brevitarsis]